MDAGNLKHFVDMEFPPVLRAQIPLALKAAYAAVESLYETTPFLKVVSAQIGKGHLIGWAVDSQLVRLIETGKLPFKYRWAPFARPTGRYLLLELGSSTMSVSQLLEPTAVPRRAHFRQNHSLNNSPFLNLPGFEEERALAGLPHLVLGHGYQTLTFAQIGVLYPNGTRDGWIYRTADLLKTPHILETNEPKVEAADADAVVTLRDELKRWMLNHANDA
jgi:hypothetical protein